MIKRWVKRLLRELLLDDPEVRAALTRSALHGLRTWALKCGASPPPGTASWADLADRQPDLTVVPTVETQDLFGEADGG